MSPTLERAPADHEMERKHAASAARESSVSTDASRGPLARMFNSLGSGRPNDGKSKLASGQILQRRASGEMRAIAMRSAQQGVGNHRTQQLVTQLKRSSVVQRQCSCGGTCSSCQSKSIEEEETPKILQRQPSNASDGRNEAEADVIPSDSAGQPLDRETRDFMEPRFSTDFSDVRVHTNSRAAESADALAADAYTTGRDIYFAAGKYAPSTPEGRHLLAHELTHTVQQSKGAVPFAASRTGNVMIGRADDPLEEEAQSAADLVTGGEDSAGPISADAVSVVRRLSWDDIEEGAESLASGAEDVGEAVVSKAEDVGEAVVSKAEDVGEAVVSKAEDVGEAVVSGAKTVGHAVVSGVEDAADWLETEAGKAASAVARFLGVGITITSAGLEISVAKMCPIPAITHNFKLPSLDKKYMLPVVALPLGPVAIVGEIGIAGHLKPLAEIQVGPFCLEGVHILINPITGAYSISGAVSATAGASLGAEVRLGLRGEVSLDGVIPIGGIPVPIEIPLLGVEGGVAGLVRGLGAGTLIIGQGLSISGGTISLSRTQSLNLGLAADLFLGAYAQLDILGDNVCRIYWEPYQWHGQIAGSFGMSLGLTIAPGIPPIITPIFSPPTFNPIAFDQIPLALSRKGFKDDCPLIERLCEILRKRSLLPSQNGGIWNWSGPYGPGAHLAGPLDVYEKNPGIPSGSECRGACGPNCDTCTATPVYRYTDPATGDVWEYSNFQACNSNAGCREHDAAFDWAADKHGEKGKYAILYPWHMAANIECACNNLAGNCIAWIAGLPPYDMKMYFADTATLIPGGGKIGPSSAGSCHIDYPNAPNCVGSYLDRDAVLANWGALNRIGKFRDCVVYESWTAGSMLACDGGPGNIWHCRATDEVTGQDVTVSIFECICCKPEDTPDSEWRQPEIVIEPGMSEELILELCDRKLISRVICIPIEENMIARFGNKRRDLNLDPDKDPKTTPRPDDAPIFDTFRRAYNRLDSWSIYIRAHNEDLFPEFESKFDVEKKRAAWLEELKQRTKEYKDTFRNLQTTDPAEAQRKYEAAVVGDIQDQIEKTVREIAVWYKAKTGTTESIEDLIERVHTEGTELWRAAWRRAILLVNRVLALLWPPAKTLILVWIGREQSKHPELDLSGPVGELDYIGSLATGFKGPPKQQIRFNPDKFDVDANLDAPPLAKYAVAVDGIEPDRKRIFGRTTSITPLNDFSSKAHSELSAKVPGYNASDPFDVAIDAPELPKQAHERVATERLYKLRTSLDAAQYKKLLDELVVGGFLTAGGQAVRPDLTEAEFTAVNAIMDRYEPK